jgi:hypothetical protein
MSREQPGQSTTSQSRQQGIRRRATDDPMREATGIGSTD